MPLNSARSATLTLSGGPVVGDRNVAFTTDNTPRVLAYPWNNGFGTKYTNPATVPTGLPFKLRFSNSGEDLAIPHGDFPQVTAYPFNNGFGTKYSNPAVVPGGGGGNGSSQDLTFHPNDTDLVIASNLAPRMDGYAWSSGFGTKYANPAFAVPNSGASIAFSKTGDHVVIGFLNLFSPFFRAYNFVSGSGFGTALSNSAVGAPATVLGLNFSPSNSIFVAGASTLPHAWNWLPGFGTKYANPATTPFGNVDVNDVQFASNEAQIAMVGGASPFIRVINWSAGFGTYIANPVIIPTNTGRAVSFSLSNTVLAATQENTPFINVYDWDNPGFGTRYATPGDFFATSRGVSWN